MTLGFLYLLWGILYLIGFGKMIQESTIGQVNLASGRLIMLKEALKAWFSGNMSVDHVLYLSWTIGFLGVLTIGLTLIIIASFMLRPKYKLPPVSNIFIILMIVSLCWMIWTCIKDMEPAGILVAIPWVAVLYYSWYSRKQNVDGPVGLGCEIAKGMRWLFNFLLATMVLFLIISIVLNLELPLGMMIH